MIKSRRNCKKNLRNMKYSLYGNEVEILDSNGYPTFEKETKYFNPIDFKASLSAGKSDDDDFVYGKDVSYDRTIITRENLPITINTLIWVTSEPIIDEDGYIVKESADYIVSALPIDGLDSLKFALSYNNKG